MAWNNKKPDYTGAKAHDYIDSYVNRPEDMGSVEGLQNILSGVGMMPGVGEPADLLNAILYGAQGKGEEAGPSLLAMLPFIGGSIKPLKQGRRIFSKTKSKSGTQDETLKALEQSPAMRKISGASNYELERMDADVFEDIRKGTQKEGSFFKKYLEGLFDDVSNVEF